MKSPASCLVATLKQFEGLCDSRVEAAVAFSGYLVAQREALDKVLQNGDTVVLDDECLSIYCTMAVQVLDEHNDSTIRQFVPELERELRSKQIEELRARIDERTQHVEMHVTQRTDFKSALFANLAAWAVSILITAAVIVLFLLPGLEDSLAERLRPAIAP